MDLADTLKGGLGELHIEASAEQQQKLLLLLEQLLKWNKTYNLTAISNPVEALKLHIFDSLAVLPFMRQNKISKKTILDVGTGAGFPGLPLAIMHPEVRFHLLDSNSKKIRFIRQLCYLLGLKKVTAVHSRVENFNEERFDWIISRAFASTNDMLQATKHLLKKQGRWLAMKAQSEEFNDFEQNIVANCLFHPLKVPFLNASRCLLELIPIETTT